jgi:hypothetical protein
MSSQKHSNLEENIMKTISALILTIATGAALMSANVSPASTFQEKNEVSLANKFQTPAEQTSSLGGAINIIAPQKDLEAAVRNAEYGDILLLGPEGWYRLEGKALTNGTRIYILGNQGSKVASFPKEENASYTR